MHDLGMRCFSKTCPMVSRARSGRTALHSKGNFNILHKIMHKQDTIFHTLNILKTVVKQY